MGKITTITAITTTKKRGGRREKLTTFNVSRQKILFKNSDSQTQQKYKKPLLSYLQVT